MTTGYYRQDWRMGGAVPGKVTSAAGSRIAIFDHIFTTGPSPWTKTVLGTNIVQYQAPGGSQVKLEINDTGVIASAQYHIRVRISIGAGALIPNPTLEASGSYGMMLIPLAESNTSLWYSGWYAIRTDRFVIMIFGGSTNGTGCYSFIAGDLPTYDPADPGLCVLLGYATNVYNSFPSASVYRDSIFGTTATGSLRKAGFCTIDKQNTFSPAPAAVMPEHSAFYNGTLTSYAGYVPLGYIQVVSQTTAFTSMTSTAGVLRGWIPFVRTMPTFSTFITAFSSSNTPTGDTFTADGVNFEIFTGIDTGQRFALMLTDDEDLP